MEESTKNRNHFRYTRSYGILSQADREFYECNGYVILRNFIPLNIIKDCSKHFNDICDGRAPPPPLVMRERSLLKSGRKGQNIIHKVQHLANDDVFRTYFENPKLLEAIQDVVGPDLHLLGSNLINKPHGSLPHEPHQDFVFLPIDAENCIVAAWTAMEKADTENGCLFVIPGSHKLTFLDHSIDANANAGFLVINNIADFAAEHKRVSLIMDAGDTVLFHPLLIHGSWDNKSDRFRKSLTGHYCNGIHKFGERYKIGYNSLWNLHRTSSEKKGIPFLSYNDFWFNQIKYLNKNKSKI